LRGRFGYVEFETTEQATAAIEAKHQTIFEGRRLVVNYQVQRSTSFSDGSNNPPSKTLFVGNLAFEMTDADLNKLFREIRNVTDVRVAIDRRTGQPRGFAHADFADVESAVKGKELLAGKEVYGRALRVDFSASGAPAPAPAPADE
jgi:nucleolin